MVRHFGDVQAPLECGGSAPLSFSGLRGDEVITQLIPAVPRSRLKVRDLNAFLAKLPKLGEDAEAFLEDLRAIRRESPSDGDSLALREIVVPSAVR